MQVVEKMGRVVLDGGREAEQQQQLISSFLCSQEQYSYSSPPPSPAASNMGSRAGSIRSVNSFSSRPSSVASGTAAQRSD